MNYEAAYAHAGHMASETHYKLRCQGCDAMFEDDGFILECSKRHEPALMAAEYRDKRFEPDTGAEGMFRYRRWLPGTHILSGAGGSVTYKSKRLNRIIGLPNVWSCSTGIGRKKALCSRR